MSENNQEQNVIEAWQSLIEKSIKANTEFLQESGKIFTNLLSKKPDVNNLQDMNKQLMSDAVNNFVKMNIKHTENMMDFGMNVSKSLTSFLDKVSKSATTTTTEQTPSQNTNGSNKINLSIQQGQQITTSFYLNSHNAFAQSGKFNYGDFVDASGNSVGLTLAMAPKEFTLDPGKSIKVDISITASADVPLACYKTTVKLEGMDNQEFDITVDVLENKPSENKPSENKSPATQSLESKSVKGKPAAKAKQPEPEHPHKELHLKKPGRHGKKK